MSAGQQWVSRGAGTIDLKDLADFVAWAYGSGGTDATPIRVETNITMRATQVGIKKIWMGEQ